MNLYTVFFEFRGGTYLKQIQAHTPQETIDIWAKTLDTKEIQYMSSKTKTELIENIPHLIDELVKVDNMQNVWFTAMQLKTGFANIYLIQSK